MHRLFIVPFSLSIKALTQGILVILFAGVFMAAGSGLARAAADPDKCPATGILGPGTGNDLLIDRECHVGDGTYQYGNVNIINGGQLIFDEAKNTLNVRIHFWASAILVEYGGSLMAGSPPGASWNPGGAPFGTYGGVLTIHLYGDNKGTSGAGIPCKSNNAATNPPCGIPSTVWNANGKPVSLPGGDLKVPQYTDIFYQYDAMPFDDGINPATNSIGYFGYKVLAVSVGGTLQLYGKKGAFYGASDLNPQQSGTSWVRLNGSILGKTAKSLTVASPVDWEVGDHIVVTTTDYLPSHSEELVICKITGNTIDFDAAYNAAKPCPDTVADRKAIEWTHNGEPYDLSRLPSRLKIKKTVNGKQAAETRAAVGLLSRSIRIVSEGKIFGQPLPPAPCPSEPCTDYYFGGHTIVRQGFAAFQVQGVEFRQLGQGGRIAHYPVHFHMARKTPPNTFIKDSSINESMTRWITVHGTQGVLVERNVGYLSIGHGFYIEDAVETDNKFYSNLGVFARASVQNTQNPRKVPGILASPDEVLGNTKFTSDKATPAVFWITNGWNEFQGNMAAGAGMCGVCFWEIPAYVSGPSRTKVWASYASEQDGVGRAGTSPLKNFDGNFCTSAMTSFQTVGYTSDCFGVGQPFPDVSVVTNPLAPASNAVSPACGPGTQWPLCPDDYYPNVQNGNLHQATQCPAANPNDPADPTTICNEANAPECVTPDGNGNCMPTVINDYTSSFHWAPYNFAAIWLRSRWHLVSNSFISDVQNAGLTFISGGDYTRSSAIKGLWELALQTVFVGQTQKDDINHAFASVLSPFNTNTGLQCDNAANQQLYCISINNSITMGPFSAFGVSQHVFNIYDGPASEDSNAFLDIKTKDLGTTTDNFIYKLLQGTPKVVSLDPVNPIPAGHCYMPNAAIAWKQSNGFYYPPNFRSENLFFDNVDIRHYVIVPQFNADTYQTNIGEVQKRYCFNQSMALNFFDNFTAIDRQTELTDDDGSLTGYVKTTSVNQDAFFSAPIEGPECQSDASVPSTEGGTAKTSPYDYVTTAIYPDDAKNRPDPPPTLPPTCKGGPYSIDPNWASDCSNPNCYGVPLYRLDQTKKEHDANSAPPFIRMAGFNICQRETMSANHGLYFVDTTVSPATQAAWPTSPPGTPPETNVFVEKKAYDFFHVYANGKTEQTFKIYVGSGFNPKTDLKKIRVNINSGTFKICIEGDLDCPTIGDATTIGTPTYEDPILTVTLNQSAFTKQLKADREGQCVPKTFCKWNPSSGDGQGGCVAQTIPKGVFSNLSPADQNSVCAHAGEDIDCPSMLLHDGKTRVPGCVGFQITLPAGFVANDQALKTTDPKTGKPWPTSNALCFPKDANWNVTPKKGAAPLLGSCATARLSSAFCSP